MLSGFRFYLKKVKVCIAKTLSKTMRLPYKLNQDLLIEGAPM